VEKIRALTIIDKATGWLDFVAIKNKPSQHIALLFDSEWLCHNPRPEQVVMEPSYWTGISRIIGQL
jgi:hypothetical protein